CLERLLTPGSDHTGGDRLRKLPDVGVVPTDRLVVVAARHGNPVLALRELILQGLEALSRAELRVGLYRHIDVGADLTRDRSVSGGQLLDVATLDRGVDLFARLLEPRARLGDLGEGAPFEVGGTLNGGDDVRDQIVPVDELD